MALFSRSTPAPVGAVEVDSLAPNALIGLRNIEKSYAHGTSRTYVLRRINLDIKEGEFISIMGPSGAGKSTLLHIIGMHDSAWTGEYYFLDQPVHKLGAKDRAKLHKQNIGFVFQSYHLLDHLTVYENLDIPLSYRDIRKAERESMVCDILDKFAIVGKKDSIRTSSPADSSSSSPSRARSSPIRRSFSPTSRPATCTRARARRSWSSSRS